MDVCVDLGSTSSSASTRSVKARPPLSTGSSTRTDDDLLDLQVRGFDVLLDDVVDWYFFIYTTFDMLLDDVIYIYSSCYIVYIVLGVGSTRTDDDLLDLRQREREMYH